MASVDIQGGGDITCPSPYGCEASISFVPVLDAAATLDPEWLPEDAARFGIEPIDGSTWMVISAAVLPNGLAPGHYLVVGAVAMTSDVASSAPDGSGPVVQILGSNECVTPLEVDETTTLVQVDVGFIDGSCRLFVGKTPEAGRSCPGERPWPGISLDGIDGMTATSRDQSRIELHNGTDRPYSYRVNTWEWYPPGTCGELVDKEVVRGRIPAGKTLPLDVYVPFEFPVTIAFWEGLCGEACDADPFAAMLVTRSPERPMATD